MTTKLTKAVYRRTMKPYDAAKRFIVVGLEPGDLITLRLSRSRKAEAIPIAHVYEIAVKARVFAGRPAKKALRKK